MLRFLMLSSDPAMMEAWRATRDGFAPLFLEPVMATAFAHLAVGPDAIVLDLGSGNGQVAHAARACGGRTICLEVDHEVLRQSNHRYPGGHHVMADAARLPLADGSVDAVFCFSVLQYANRDLALHEIRRVLRPSGRVVLVENLAGNLVAKLYRAWRWLVRIRYPKRLTPVNHVAWAQRSRYLTAFPAAHCDAFFVTSAALLMHPAVYRADAAEPRRSWVRAALAATHRLDSALLRRIPWLRHAAWILVVRA